MKYRLFAAGIRALSANFSCMKKTTETPIITEQSWQERAEKAEAQVTALLQEMEYLKAQVRLLTAKRYGASSEKSKHKTYLMKRVPRVKCEDCGTIRTIGVP